MLNDDTMNAARVLVDQALTEQLDQQTGVPERLGAAMRHAVLVGGKRFRPFLVLESAALFGIDPIAAVTTAAALECVHAYSLVHDDLPAMDNDRLRRGQPTVWAAFDEWTAILAGDALLTMAFEMLSQEAAHPDPAVRVTLIAELAKASGASGMVGGQMLDLAADKRGEPAMPDAQHIRHLQSLKTGALIRFACEAGAILAKAPAVKREALADYGTALGLAFQISDDLLDAEGDAATVGKATGKDAAAGKATLVGLIGNASARVELYGAISRARVALGSFGTKATTLIAAAELMAERRS
jgi:farnesyl diphosphate synthase